MKRRCLGTFATLALLTTACFPVFTNPPERTVQVDPAPYIGEWDLVDTVFDPDKYRLFRNGDPVSGITPTLHISVTEDAAGDVYVTDPLGGGDPSTAEITEVGGNIIASVNSDPGWGLWKLDLQGNGDRLVASTLDLWKLHEDIVTGTLQGGITETDGEEGYGGLVMMVDESPTALRAYLESNPQVMTDGVSYVFDKVEAGGARFSATYPADVADAGRGNWMAIGASFAVFALGLVSAVYFGRARRVRR